MVSSKKKVLVIGLDGATWDLIDPWMKCLKRRRNLCQRYQE